MSTAIELGRTSADRATIDLGRRRWLVLGVMALASAMVMVSNTVLNTALPAMARDLEAGTSTLLWIVNGSGAPSLTRPPSSSNATSGSPVGGMAGPAS